MHSPSWAANWFAASQENPRISRNPKVHYRTHKRLPPVSILGQPNPVRIPTSHPWRSILILSTHLRLDLPSGLLPSGFPSKTLYTPLSSPIRATCPAHLILLDFIIRTMLGEEYNMSICLYVQSCSKKCNFLFSTHEFSFKEELSNSGSGTFSREIVIPKTYFFDKFLLRNKCNY